jgi:hypothetical protein
VHDEAEFDAADPSEDGEGDALPWVAGAILGRDLGALQATASVGVAHAAEVGPEIGTALQVHGALVMPWRRLRLSGEVFWQHLGNADETYLTPGLTACLAGDLELGVGAAFGVADVADRFRLAVRATYEFGGADRD